jgi:hypothetical protein
MKKVISLTIIASLFVMTSFAQTFDKVRKALYYTYEKEQWVAGTPTYPERMFIIIKGSEVRVTNKSDSKYITYGDNRHEKTSDYDSDTWDAYDEDGSTCTLMITKYFDVPGYSVFVMYADKNIAIQYITEEK